MSKGKKKKRCPVIASRDIRSFFTKPVEINPCSKLIRTISKNIQEVNSDIEDAGVQCTSANVCGLKVHPLPVPAGVQCTSANVCGLKVHPLPVPAGVQCTSANVCGLKVHPLPVPAGVQCTSANVCGLKVHPLPVPAGVQCTSANVCGLKVHPLPVPAGVQCTSANVCGLKVHPLPVPAGVQCTSANVCGLKVHPLPVPAGVQCTSANVCGLKVHPLPDPAGVQCTSANVCGLKVHPLPVPAGVQCTSANVCGLKVHPLPDPAGVQCTSANVCGLKVHPLPVPAGVQCTSANVCGLKVHPLPVPAGVQCTSANVCGLKVHPLPVPAGVQCTSANVCGLKVHPLPVPSTSHGQSTKNVDNNCSVHVNVNMVAPAKQSSITSFLPDYTKISSTTGTSSPVPSRDSAPSSVYSSRCPAYKRVAMCPIVVDAFSYGSIPGVDAYFLTHFHYDHYRGLNKYWKHKIYCSKLTGDLIQKRVNINAKLIHRLALEQTVNVNGALVTLIEANHCPGAVMFLFETMDAMKHLHSGDMRAEQIIYASPTLSSLNNLNSLYLDTTYLDSRYKHPKQEEAISEMLNIVKHQVMSNPKRILIVCGTYLIGKERVLKALANLLSVKIGVSKEKMDILKIEGDKDLTRLLTMDLKSTYLHVQQMKPTVQNLQDLLSKYPQYKRVVGIWPSGWEKTCQIKMSACGNTGIIGLPYSEHSSYSELEKFIKFLKPAVIIPTVNRNHLSTMSTIINKWFPSCDIK